MNTKKCMWGLCKTCNENLSCNGEVRKVRKRKTKERREKTGDDKK